LTGIDGGLRLFTDLSIVVRVNHSYKVEKHCLECIRQYTKLDHKKT